MKKDELIKLREAAEIMNKEKDRVGICQHFAFMCIGCAIKRLAEDLDSFANFYLSEEDCD